MALLQPRALRGMADGDQREGPCLGRGTGEGGRWHLGSKLKGKHEFAFNLREQPWGHAENPNGKCLIHLKSL